MICPADESLNPRGELLMQCKSSVKGAVESIHRLVDAMEGKNNGGEYYVIKSGMKEYFGRCAAIINMIQEEAPRPIIITINTTAEIFALNEPLKRYVDVITAGVKPPALAFKPLAFIERCRGVGGKLTTETEGLMWYVLDRRLARERVLSSAMLKSQTIWEIEDKILGNLSEKKES